jgi:hypothetical protein
MVGRPRGPRRKLVWATVQQIPAGTLASGGKANFDLLGNLETVGASVLGCTVIRTIVLHTCSEATADTNQGMYVGLLHADVVNVTNIDPSTNFGADWSLLTVNGPPTAQQVYFSGTNTIWGQRYDIKAKRKIEELGEKYLLCFENAGSGQVSYTFFARTLIALP